jgi:hypothetical protein
MQNWKLFAGERRVLIAPALFFFYDEPAGADRARRQWD